MKRLSFFLSISFIICLFLYGYGSEPSGSGIGVVDIDKLLKIHKDWSKLEALDKQVQAFEEGFASNEFKHKMNNFQKDAEKKFKSLISEYDGRLKKKNEELKVNWTTEQNSIMGQLQALQDRFSARQKAEMEKIKSEHQSEIEQIQKEFEAKMTAELNKKSAIIHQKYRPDLDKENQAVQAMLDQYVNTLIVERDNKAKKKRDALLLELDSVLTAERNRLMGDLEDYKQKRMEENQQALLKVNLEINQLNAKNTHDKEDEEELQKLIAEKKSIDSSYERDIAGETRKVEDTFTSFKNKKMAEIDGIIGDYTKDLNAGMNSKIDAKKKEFDDIVQVKGSDVDKKVRAELENCRSSVENQYASLMRSKEEKIQSAIGEKWNIVNEQLSREYEAEKKALIAELEKKHGDVEQSLKSFSEQLEREFEAKKKELGKELSKTQSTIAGQKQQDIEKVMKEREKLFNSIMKDISTQVETVAKEKGVPVVLTGYRVNVNGLDLTEDMIKVMEKK
ncbi:MAG: OmpH family outer membrane protein [Candidatus Eremiobacterota bacterium]